MPLWINDKDAAFIDVFSDVFSGVFGDVFSDVFGDVFNDDKELSISQHTNQHLNRQLNCILIKRFLSINLISKVSRSVFFLINFFFFLEFLISNRIWF